MTTSGSPHSAPLHTSQVLAAATRKATLRLVPLIALGYGCAYLDRVNVSFAALQMNHQLGFSPAVYGFGAGLFFLPYAAFEIPSNLLLYRFGARRWLARIMFTWGIFAMLMASVRTPGQFYAARFLLGLAEAGFFPGVVFYLLEWFPPGLRARTISRFYVSLPLSSVLMGLLAGPILGLNHRLGLAGWQWLFLIEGLPPVLLSFAFLRLLPNTPADAPWLSPAERLALSQAIPEPAPAAETHRISHALRDRRVWQLGCFNFVMLASSYAYTFVAPDLLQHSTGRSTAFVGNMLAVMNLLGAGAMILGASLSDRRSAATGGRSRFYWIIPCCLCISAGFAGCGLSQRPAVVVPSLAFLIVTYMAMQGPLWAIPPTFLKGRSAAAGIAVINMVGMLGGFLGPYWIGMARKLTGDYGRGMLLMTLPMLVGAGIMLRLAASSPQKHDVVSSFAAVAPDTPQV